MVVLDVPTLYVQPSLVLRVADVYSGETLAFKRVHFGVMGITFGLGQLFKRHGRPAALHVRVEPGRPWTAEISQVHHTLERYYARPTDDDWRKARKL